MTPGTTRNGVLSSGLSWPAIAAIGAIVVGIGAPVGIGMWTMNERLASMDGTLKQVAQQHVDDRAEHAVFRRDIADGKIRVENHETRLKHLENNKGTE